MLFLQELLALPPTSATVHPPWERQRRDASGKSTTAQVGAGSPSHEYGWKSNAVPAGAPGSTAKSAPRASTVHPLWERQRRDTRGKSTTA